MGKARGETMKRCDACGWDRMIVHVDDYGRQFCRYCINDFIFYHDLVKPNDQPAKVGETKSQCRRNKDSIVISGSQEAEK